MKGYGQFCPIAMACETFAERWTPLILRELLNGGRRFNEIRMGLPLISRTLLGQRLRELEAAGVQEVVLSFPDVLDRAMLRVFADEVLAALG